MGQSYSYFVVGVVFGVGCSFAFLIYLLSSKENPNENKVEASVRVSEQSETLNKSNEKEILDSALATLNIFDIADKTGNSNESTFTPQSASAAKSKYQITPIALNPNDPDSAAVLYLEKLFLEESKASKERDKQLKNMCSFFIELGKSIKSNHKELLKLSNSALGNTGKGSEVDPAVDNWWNAIGISLEHFSLDQQSLSESISNDITKSLNLILETHTTCSKRFLTEGTVWLNQWNEISVAYEAKLKERDKNRDRLNTVMDKGVPVSMSTSITNMVTGDANAGSNSASAGVSSVDVYKKYIVRLETSETSLLESSERLAFVQKDFRIGMTKVCSDLQLTALAALVDLEKALLKYAHSSSNAYGNADTIIQTMREQFQSAAASTNASAGDGTASAGPVVMGYESALRETLRGGASLTAAKADASGGVSGGISDSASGGVLGAGAGEASLGQIAMLDLSKEAAAILSAAPPTRLPKLPSSFQHSIGRETCVWFNAFTGRIYRDIASSAYFHNWFCTKTSNVLNKGKRPDYIDEFKVVDVEFGLLPPLLMNVQWSTHTSGANVAASPTGTPTTNQGVGPSNTRNTTSAATGTESEYASFNEADYDVECTADLALRSTIKVKIATKLWINWPSEHYASINVMLILEVSDITGRVKFGVDRGSTFLSFIGEPSTRFRVHSEIGQQFKLKDVPKLSSFVVKKIKEFIRKKIVYPNCHRFRLAWPRNWWPAGTENNFMPSGAKSKVASSAAAVSQITTTPAGTGAGAGSPTLATTVTPATSPIAIATANRSTSGAAGATSPIAAAASNTTITTTATEVEASQPKLLVSQGRSLSARLMGSTVSSKDSLDGSASGNSAAAGAVGVEKSIKIPNVRGTLSNWLGMKSSKGKETPKAASDSSSNMGWVPPPTLSPRQTVDLKRNTIELEVAQNSPAHPDAAAAAVVVEANCESDIEDDEGEEYDDNDGVDEDKKWSMLVQSICNSYNSHFRNGDTSTSPERLILNDNMHAYHSDDSHDVLHIGRMKKYSHPTIVTNSRMGTGHTRPLQSSNQRLDSKLCDSQDNEAPLHFKFIPLQENNKLVTSNRDLSHADRLQRGALHTISRSRFHRSWSFDDFRPEYVDALSHHVFLTNNPAIDSSTPSKSATTATTSAPRISTTATEAAPSATLGQDNRENPASDQVNKLSERKTEAVTEPSDATPNANSRRKSSSIVSLFENTRGTKPPNAESDAKSKTGGKLEGWLAKAKDKAKDKYSQFKAKHFASHDESSGSSSSASASQNPPTATGGLPLATAVEKRHSFFDHRSGSISADMSPVRESFTEATEIGKSHPVEQDGTATARSSLEQQHQQQQQQQQHQQQQQQQARTMAFDDGSTSEYLVRVKLSQPTPAATSSHSNVKSTETTSKAGPPSRVTGGVVVDNNSQDEGPPPARIVSGMLPLESVPEIVAPEPDASPEEEPPASRVSDSALEVESRAGSEAGLMSGVVPGVVPGVVGSGTGSTPRPSPSAATDPGISLVSDTIRGSNPMPTTDAAVGIANSSESGPVSTPAPAATTTTTSANNPAHDTAKVNSLPPSGKSSRASSILGNFKLPTSPSRLEDFLFGEDSSRPRSSSLQGSGPQAASAGSTGPVLSSSAPSAQSLSLASSIAFPFPSSSTATTATNVDAGTISVASASATRADDPPSTVASASTLPSTQISHSETAATGRNSTSNAEGAGAGVGSGVGADGSASHDETGGQTRRNSTSTAGMKFVSMLKSKAADKKNSLMRVISHVAHPQGGKETARGGAANNNSDDHSSTGHS